jgi:hypothetical protein
MYMIKLILESIKSGRYLHMPLKKKNPKGDRDAILRTCLCSLNTEEKGMAKGSSAI